MEAVYAYSGLQEEPKSDLQWFFAKSKVSISLAMTQSSPFLYSLNYTGALSEEELLELMGDNKSAHEEIYHCLCCIEEKKFPIKNFFEQLFDKENLKNYPDLKPIYDEYSTKNYKNRSQASANDDADLLIFSQDKVKICVAITTIFPFVHGLQDLGILSELESLKLQADKRPVSRVIYECLSLIEKKKDFKLSAVFEYIFQGCFLKLYPGLEEILQEPDKERVEHFHGQHIDILRTCLRQNKEAICDSIDDRFPFLHGLHDVGLLSRIQLLRLQADKRAIKTVLVKALSLIEQRNDLEEFFSYVFRDFYLNRFPNLKIIRKMVNESLMADASPSVAVTDHGRVQPVLEQPTPVLYPNQHLPDASAAPQEHLYRTQYLAMGSTQKERRRKKIYRCDYEGCEKGFSDRSEYKTHRKEHEGPQPKKKPHWRKREKTPQGPREAHAGLLFETDCSAFWEQQ